MNYKFRKKPVVVEALQMTEARMTDETDWPDWIRDANNKVVGQEGCVYSRWALARLVGMGVWTMAGPMDVCFDDYLIRGVKGEIYPCKPDIFEATYEEVRGDSTAVEDGNKHITKEQWRHAFHDECPTCGEVMCPEGEPLHLHHDGCPQCATKNYELPPDERAVAISQMKKLKIRSGLGNIVIPAIEDVNNAIDRCISILEKKP